MNETIKRQIADFEEKIARQNKAIESYREELKKHINYKSERDLYSELSTTFARTTNSDDMLKKTLEALSLHLKARYFGVFLLDAKNEFFEYRHGKGYAAASFPRIPFIGSLMGRSLLKGDVIWEPGIKEHAGIISLNQVPAEYNVLCAPIILMGQVSGVIRLANIDPSISEKALPIMQTVTRLLRSNLERLILQEKNEWNRRSLDVSFSIARLLEETLDPREILKRVCLEVPRLFGCVGCVLALRDNDGMPRPVASWPDNFIPTGNPSSGTIYLRNLMALFPEGNGLVGDIHRDDQCRSWTSSKVKSLCMAPIRMRNQINGVLIAVGPPEELYEHSHANFLGIVAAQTSMTLERATYFQQQENLARCDGLTGLFNHRVFQEVIREEATRVRRYGHPLTLIMFDIDHFKKCNDTYGHPVGDEVIKMVSKCIRSLIRSSDKAFRYGGEEFTIMLPETTRDNGHAIAERLRRQIEENRTVQDIPVTISCGVVGISKNESPEGFIERADKALYFAKESGRNRVALG